MILYHGSNQIVTNPKIIEQNRTLDFGFGFYTTVNEKQAEAFAIKVARRRKGRPIVNVYSIDEKNFEKVKYLEFKTPDETWLDFICQNRNGTYSGEKFDIIKGPVANDDVYRTVTLFLSGVISREVTIESLKIKKLFNQIVFTSNEVLSLLQFIKSYQILNNNGDKNE